jgi:hypothetical protein
MQRRTFLKKSAETIAAGALARAAWMPAEERDSAYPFFSTADARWQAAYDTACSILAKNVRVLPRYNEPVLIEGAQYAGLWQECGPQEGLLYRHFRPDAARNNHMMFFALQRPDGQLPANNKRTGTGFGQIQMVVPIAATAWELARMTGDEELLRTAYEACGRWDGWLTRYRNTRRTGLIEGFCTYDTGMDNSSRWAGMPNQCPGEDARRCPPIATLPRLCPDLSATVYGGRLALAGMAAALGKSSEAEAWSEHAEKIRRLIVQRLYAPKDAAFYDLDAQNHFVKVLSVVITRVCGAHVVDQPMFDEIWRRQIGNPHAFWALYPIPSTALDDPSFIRPIPHNCWAGASQALTALRAPRWMEHYGRSAELGHLMEQWCEAEQRDMSFRQQLDPVTGVFSEGDKPEYSPSSLVMVDFTWRLAGISEEAEELQWNVRPRMGASRHARFRVKLRGGMAEMDYEGDGTTLTFAGRRIARVMGMARVVTDHIGKMTALVGISPVAQQVQLQHAGKAAESIMLRPNERVSI